MPYDDAVHVKVSIVTVVYNAADQIESTVLSVLDQNYGNVEYVVIDGGSTDGTLEILNKYRDRIACLVSERDGGIYDAMNKGITVATGEWVGLMNAGDSFAADDVLSRVFRAGQRYQGVDVLHGDAIEVDGVCERRKTGMEDVDALANGPAYRHGASFVRRETYRRFPFDLSKSSLLGFALDYEQIYRMYRAGCRFKRVPIDLIRYERRGASTVSPFKCTYYNYLITHDMKCNAVTRVWLVWLMCWRKACAMWRD